MEGTSKIERDIEQNVKNFVINLEPHVRTWRMVLQETVKPLWALSNQAEQLRHVERVNLPHMEGFEETQKSLEFQILCGIEDEIERIKDCISRLSKSNHDLRNKLSILEKSTLDLDWTKDTELLRGSAIRPPLSKLLQDGLKFVSFFTSALRKINEHFKVINVRKATSMDLLKQAFSEVDLDDKCVRYFVAITQYISKDNNCIS